MVIDRIHNHPRASANYEVPADVLIPALSKLRACRDSIDVYVLLDRLPDIILPGLAWEASRKPALYPAFAVQRVVNYCGPMFLKRCLGQRKKSLLLARYPDPKAVVSGTTPDNL